MQVCSFELYAVVMIGFLSKYYKSIVNLGCIVPSKQSTAHVFSL